MAGKLVDKMKKIYIVVNGEKNTASDSISSINRKNNTNIKKIRNGMAQKKRMFKRQSLYGVCI